MVSRTAKSLGQLHKAQRLCIVPTTDPVRVAFNQGLAKALEQDALTTLTPAHPLQVRQGEVIDCERPALTDLLEQPDLTSLEASLHRTTLGEAAGVTDHHIEAILFSAFRRQAVIGILEPMLFRRLGAS